MLKDISEILTAIGMVLIPLAVIFVALLYHKPLVELFARLTKARFKDIEVGTELPETVQAAVEQLEDAVEQAKSKLNNGKLYENYKLTFIDAERYIREYLNSSKIKPTRVEIKILAVGSAYSWKYFVSDIPQILNDFPHCVIDLKVLFVDHNYLQELGLLRKEEDWVAESKAREDDAHNLLREANDFNNRLVMTVRKYKSLPFWHGILINGEHLFIGRTNWHFSASRPQLSVGKNVYRYFNRQADKDARVERFENWHHYFFEFQSELICTNEQQILSMSQKQ